MVFLFKASYDKKKSLKIALGPDLKGEIKGETKIQWVFQGSMRKRALIDSSLLSSKKTLKIALKSTTLSGIPIRIESRIKAEIKCQETIRGELTEERPD